MARLSFDASEVRRLIEHSKGRLHGDTYYGKPLPMKEYLYLVHDEGVYLMSGAKERLPNPARPGVSFVAYASGCNPADPDCWETSRALVGGDDFGEPVPLEAFEAPLATKPRRIVVHLNKQTLRVAGGS